MFSNSVIVLCKNNPSELRFTLDSVVLQEDCSSIEVIVGDGSDNDSCLEVFKLFSNNNSDIVWVYTKDVAPFGIYFSMNRCLKLVTKSLVSFMNSGDQYSDNNSLFLLSQAISKNQNTSVNAVFGRTRIVSHDRKVVWYVPDLSVSDVNNWLRFFEPNHQGMVFLADWAKRNLFDTRSSIGADATFKSEALKPFKSSVFVDYIVSEFTLGGISSKPADFKTMIIKIREPSRGYIAKSLELIKYFLYKLLPIRYEYLMKLRSKLIGIFF